MKSLRWGILGASRFAVRTMIPALHGAAHNNVIALATRTPDKAEPVQALVSDLKVYDRYDDVIASDEIDAVYIPLPNHLHAPLAEQAMRAGKHVLVEKPIAMSVAELDQLSEVSAQTGLLCAEAFMPVHHPQWTKVRELVAAGAIGRLAHIQGDFCYYLTDPSNIRLSAQMGGGAMRDIGVYPLGTARFVVQDEPVLLAVQRDVREGVDVTVRAQMAFPDGPSFDFFVSMGARRHQSMTFFGESGVLTLTAPFNPGTYAEGTVQLLDNAGTETVWRYTDHDQYCLQAEAFARTVRQGTPFPCSLAFSRGTLGLVEMILD